MIDVSRAPLRVLGGLLATTATAAAIAWALGDGGATYRGFPIVYFCAAIAFFLQWLAFVPAFLKRTEQFYDLTGSVTYLALVATALWLCDNFDHRSIVLASLIAAWATRLGAFLFLRIRREGRDGRFDTIKSRASSFFLAWTLQGLWVFVTLAAALAAITSGSAVSMGPLELVGTCLWMVGFTVEVVADLQKSAFRRDPQNRGHFITTGLWSWSRHPNYFGEIVLWVGVAVVALPTMAGWRWVGLVSPIFVYVLLTRVSGVPLLEKRADERWRGRPAYEAYKARTSQLFLWPPRSGH